MAAAFASWLLGRPLVSGLDADWLVDVMQVEFLVIHSLPFMVLVSLWKPGQPALEGIRWLTFLALGAMYLAGGYNVAGWRGIGMFVSLTAATYLGFLFRMRGQTEKLPELAARWLANYVFFLLALIVFGTPKDVSDWPGSVGVLRAGGAYFLLLAAIEMSGIYRHPAIARAGLPGGWIAALVASKAAIEEAPKGARAVWLAVAPILGTLALSVVPLLSAGAVAGLGAHAIRAAVAWPASDEVLRAWVPLAMMTVLAAARCFQIHLVLKPREPGKRLGRARLIAFGVVIVTYGVVAVARIADDPTYHVERWVMPADAYEGFWLVEVPLLFLLVPLTWARLAFPADRRRRLIPSR